MYFLKLINFKLLNANVDFSIVYIIAELQFWGWYFKMINKHKTVKYLIESANKF